MSQNNPWITVARALSKRGWGIIRKALADRLDNVHAQKDVTESTNLPAGV